jgi:hypothetical protein
MRARAIVGCTVVLGCGYPGSTAPLPHAEPIADHVELGVRATAIAAHDDLACALLVTGRVSCWGAALRDDQRTTPGHPPETIAGLDDAVELSPSCARTRGGDVRCWNPAPALFEPRPPTLITSPARRRIAA